jgi:tetratricopeptide (TPR) repeat protein
LASALELSKISLGYYEKSGNQQCIAHSIRHIADIQSGLKNDQEAEENYQKALSIYRENPETNTLDLANAVRPYGILLKKLGRADEARPLLLEAKKLYQEVGIQAGVDEMHSLLNTSSKV